MASFFSSPASLGALDGSAGALEKASSRSFAFVSVRSSCLLCPRHFQLEWTDSNSMDGSVGRRDWPYSTGTAACWSIAHGFLTRSASGSVQISWKHRLDGGCWLHRGDEREAVQTSTFRDRHLNPPVWTLDRPLASKRDVCPRTVLLGSIFRHKADFPLFWVHVVVSNGHQTPKFHSFPDNDSGYANQSYILILISCLCWPAKGNQIDGGATAYITPAMVVPKLAC
ncbi:hypothetical protein BZA05DRAFT_229806 [Tricharina praecox]|uniref:uncharacterized protein n=1 Tax=Tricharina praecox TaxID=43433 RepID=UPI0022212653|nr:uncharacterized protein BZA05DRAFT_229806 [Tricharina praecox]KAI5841237.1 hypothetical protein BZA05DRAFT_229806 [Tricharina praecox]